MRWSRTSAVVKVLAAHSALLVTGLDVSLTVLIGLILLIGIAVKNDEAAAIRAAGLSYANLPIASDADLNRESVDAFDQLLRDTQGPTLVHCASGNRVGALAALRAAWLQGADEEAAIAEGGDGGCEAWKAKFATS